MKIGLYVHIPFCKSKCYYCDFLSFPKMDQTEAYVEALVKELANYGKTIAGAHTISSIFIGGGTPTVLSPFLLQKLCVAIKESFVLEENYEWTIEANPGTVTKDHAEVMVKSGVNRVSIGLQACQNTLLKSIGRIHQKEDWEKTLVILREAGMTNINTDLMFGLPNQSVADWKETLQEAVAKEIPHLSAYSLIIEEGTTFFERYENNELVLPTEDEEREMYSYVKSYLKDHGYEQYEISNWAKKEKRCKHNILYWQQESYIGAGLGAHSYMEGVRYHNTTDMAAYLKSEGDVDLLVVEKELITERMAMEEFMFLGLRMMEGVKGKDFAARFGCDMFEIYGDTLDKWIKEKILAYANDSLYLTERGVELSNQVFASFL
ncbi:MAG: radical SAM family heme chaperone HemW [Cellulosilyticaceae bacterium]